MRTSSGGWPSGSRTDLDRARLARPRTIRRLHRPGLAGLRQAFVQRIRSAAESLRDLPRLGRVVPELGDEITRELLVDNYRLVYEVRADTLYILRLVHGARDFASLWEDEGT